MKDTLPPTDSLDRYRDELPPCAPKVCHPDEHEWSPWEAVEKYDSSIGDLIVTGKEERVCECCDERQTRSRVGSGCTAHWRYEGD